MLVGGISGIIIRPKKLCVPHLIISISLAPVIFDTISKWAYVEEDDNIQESRPFFAIVDDQ